MFAAITAGLGAFAYLLLRAVPALLRNVRGNRGAPTQDSAADRTVAGGDQMLPPLAWWLPLIFFAGTTIVLTILPNYYFNGDDLVYATKIRAGLPEIHTHHLFNMYEAYALRVLAGKVGLAVSPVLSLRFWSALFMALGLTALFVAFRRRTGSMPIGLAICAGMVMMSGTYFVSTSANPYGQGIGMMFVVLAVAELWPWGERPLLGGAVIGLVQAAAVVLHANTAFFIPATLLLVGLHAYKKTGNSARFVSLTSTALCLGTAITLAGAVFVTVYSVQAGRLLSVAELWRRMMADSAGYVSQEPLLMNVFIAGTTFFMIVFGNAEFSGVTLGSTVSIIGMLAIAELVIAAAKKSRGFWSEPALVFALAGTAVWMSVFSVAYTGMYNYGTFLVVIWAAVLLALAGHLPPGKWASLPAVILVVSLAAANLLLPYGIFWMADGPNTVMVESAESLRGQVPRTSSVITPDYQTARMISYFSLLGSSGADQVTPERLAAMREQGPVLVVQSALPVLQRQNKVNVAGTRYAFAGQPLLRVTPAK